MNEAPCINPADCMDPNCFVNISKIADDTPRKVAHIIMDRYNG